MAEREKGLRTDTDFVHGGIIISGLGIKDGTMVAPPPQGDESHAMVERCLEVTQLAKQIFHTPGSVGGQFRFATGLEFADDDPKGRHDHVFRPTPITRVLTVVRQPGKRHPWVCHSRPLQAGSGRPEVLVLRGEEELKGTVGEPLELNRWLFEMAERELRPDNIIESLRARVARLEAERKGLWHIGNFVVGRLRPHPES